MWMKLLSESFLRLGVCYQFNQGLRIVCRQLLQHLSCPFTIPPPGAEAAEVFVFQEGFYLCVCVLSICSIKQAVADVTIFLRSSDLGNVSLKTFTKIFFKAFY